MTDASTMGGGLIRGATPASIPFSRPFVLRGVLAIAILGGLALKAYDLQGIPQTGAESSFSLLVGVGLGIALQRGRFCFFCILRDFIEFRNSSGLFSILAALAVGGVGYSILFGVFLPNPALGRLPPDAHIGPVSWVLLVAGLAFGLGMALSGACISGHLYRLGEGYSRAPLALFGALLGFGLGFRTWERLYVGTISKAEVIWLPGEIGYSKSLVLHLGVLALLALLLLRFLPEQAPREGGKLTLARLYTLIFRERWNGLVTGALVGILSMLAYLRVEPLGVTSQLGSLSRTVMTNKGWMAERLNGLDTFRGCAAVVSETITDNGWLIVGLTLASLAMGLLSNSFRLSRLTPLNAFTALLGGVAMGWGAMTALGCTVGTLLSGISAFAVSGWVFGFAVFVGVALGIKLRLHRYG